VSMSRAREVSARSGDQLKLNAIAVVVLRCERSVEAPSDERYRCVG
jgi:hypothetical protein